jgi:hypothetical protein
MSGVRAAAAWPGPALVAIMIAAVAAGAPVAPTLLLAVAIAPLLALVQPLRAPVPRHPVTLAIAAAVAALLSWAHLAVLADAAALLGARRWHACALAAALALLATLMPSAERWRGAALVIGASALLLALIAAGTALGRAPWTAWRDAATRPALVFSGGSPWVNQGSRFVRSTTVAFDEGQRVVAVTPGTFRIVETDGARRVVRDWRLAAGDALGLRPGDTLTPEAGSRVRFEPGKRVPGAPPSGSAWADAAPHASLRNAVTLLATVALGACALMPAVGRSLGVASGLTPAIAAGAASWGAYATLLAPEAGLAGSPAEALLSLSRAAALPAHGLGRAAFIGLVAVGLLALFVAAADALRQPIAEAGGARWPSVWTVVVAVAAVAAAFPSVDPWTPLAAGLGLAGGAVTAPRLAGADGARIASWPASAVGGLAGAVVFVGLIVFEARVPGPLTALHEAPVLAAAPSAWLVVKLLRREPRRAR